jgi:2-polyprenyl-3-methyl-5-hydroxy-6-metoxy-1,4-benzoquinol methylase
MRNTLERLVPALLHNGTTGNDTFKLHLDRYKFAVRHARRVPRILDLGCGVGYGSRLLKDSNPQATVVGVDISQDAVDYAARHYSHGNVSFVRSDAMTFEDDPFDVVVSLETIEHVSEPEKFVAHIARKLLRPDDTFVGVCSTIVDGFCNKYLTVACRRMI